MNQFSRTEKSLIYILAEEIAIRRLIMAGHNPANEVLLTEALAAAVRPAAALWSKARDMVLRGGLDFRALCSHAAASADAAEVPSVNDWSDPDYRARYCGLK
jgi:hypothetical protein